MGACIDSESGLPIVSATGEEITGIPSGTELYHPCATSDDHSDDDDDDDRFDDDDERSDDDEDRFDE